MSQVVEKGIRIRFGVFEADLKTGELRRSGVKVRIQGQPFKVLAVLLDNAGEIVTREELRQRLWGSDTTVDFDHSLGIAINKLRDALGDSADNPRFIETLARRGYRFIAPLAIESNSTLAEVVHVPLSDTEPSKPDNHPRRWQIATGILLLLALAAVGFTLFRPQRIRTFRISRITYSGRVVEPSIEVDRASAIVTDGARLYFSHINNARIVLAAALIANGEIQEFSLPSEIASPVISALSADQGTLLIHNSSIGDPEQPLWMVPTTGGNAQRVPNILAHDAVWTPDGSHLVYANRNSLYIARTDGTEVHKLVDLPGWGFWLRYSPAGRRMRLSLRDAAHQTVSLWEMNADGGKLHPLFAAWSDPASECCGNWSADGKNFFFQSHHTGHTDIWMRDEGRGGGDPVQLTNGPLDNQGPVASPQGRRIFFVGADPSIHLLQLDEVANRFRSMEGPLSLAALTAYSRDGQWVAWLNLMDGSLWRSRTDGSERLELTAAPLRVFMMRWSPDNDRLAVMAEKPGEPWKIYLVNASGGGMEPLLKETSNEADPNWSSDQQTLFFGRPPDRMSSDPGSKAVYTVDMRTRQVSEIAGSAGLFSPRLSPDGRYLAAMTLSQRRLMLLDRQTGTWQSLTDHAVADPQWSREGKALYFQDDLEDGKPIYRMDVSTRDLKVVARLDSLRPLNALDYRLITLAPGDLPVVSASTSAVNIDSISLDDR